MKAKHYIKPMSILLAASVLIAFSGCFSRRENPGTAEAGPPAASETLNPVETEQPAKNGALKLETAFGWSGEAYVPVQVTPNVAPYEISPDLSNVVNLGQFPNLTAEQMAKIAENGFVVAPGRQEQLFYIYEDNTYKKIPNFVTTDSVLQVYHVFFDYALRSVEGMMLLPEAARLNENMIAQVQKEYETIEDPEVKPEAGAVLAYFGAAQLAFGQELPADFPAELRSLVESEMELIESASGVQESPIFGYKLDYSLFTPRGHYTRSEELTKYFLGMSWYGVVPFPLYKADGKTPDKQSAMRSIIASAALARLPDEDGGKLWESIYSTSSFFVGSADDLTPYQLSDIIIKVYGADPDLNSIADPAKLDEFYREAEALPRPRINAAVAGNEGIPTGPQFRFMGQRYIPDSEILQELCEPVLRPFPTGLDVFATLGSDRAADIIAEVYRPTDAWPEYTENFRRLRENFLSLPDTTWQSNMYYGWLWTQTSLIGEYGEGYPMFMRSTAWQDKSLATALGSWAEMRHDTILYAKGSAAECGGFDAPPVVRAYVEPNPELYNRLLWLTKFSRENLSERGILPENIEYMCESFENLLAFLRDCSIKELSGIDLTAEEYDSLLTYGGTLEYLTSNSVENGYKWFQIESATDRNMAVIADVHTVYPNSYLEEAVGQAAEIYVVVPMGGELYLTRGAMFDYFEFVSNERLTDEGWQEMVATNPPERPPFTSSFMEGEAAEVPAPIEPYTTGC